MNYDEGGGLGRLLPLFGGLIVVLGWISLWWDAGVVRGVMVPQPLQMMPGAAEIESLGAAIMQILGVIVVALVFVFFMRGQRSLAKELKIKDAELKDCRERLRRHVADLERVSDVAAHDLQEPLRRMVAYAQLLEHHDRGGLDEESKLYVSYVVDGARRMKALISGLRAFVSVDSQPLVQETAAAANAVVVARQRLADSLAIANAALVVDPLPHVAVDQASLVEIFVQLIDNAVRFHSPSRRPVVHLSAERDGDMVRFFVRDNGIGIEASRVARMFEIFYRPHGAEKAAGTGVGMGLAVVRRLVERLGGTVAVESEKDKGSTFSFTLPADPISAEGHYALGREATAP